MWKFYIDGQEVDEPIGWDSVSFFAKRLESHGMDQPFTTELTFIGSSAVLLKNIYNENFINATTPFTIESQTNVNGSQYVFNGFIDFSIWSEEKTKSQTGWQITVGVLEEEFREKFLARQNVELDLLKQVDLDQNPISELQLETVRLHTQELFLQGRAGNYSVQTTTLVYTNAGWILDNFAALLPAYFRNSDFKEAFGSTFNPTQTKYTTFSPCFENNSEFVRTIDLSIKASGDFVWGTGYTGDTANIAFSIQVLDASFVETQRYYLFTSAVSNYVSGGPQVPVDWAFDVVQTLTLDPDDKVYIFMQWGGDGNVKPGTTPTPNDNHNLGLQVEDCCLIITENNSAAFATTCQGLYPFNFLQRVIEQMTGDAFGLVSDFFTPFTGCMWNFLLTNGLYIRNASTVFAAENGCPSDEDEPNLYQLKTSWKQIFDGLDRIFCLGWQFEQDGYGSWKIRVEPRRYFYSLETPIATFDRVSQIRQFALSDEIVNSVTLGYSDKWKNIAVAGIYEIHTERSYFIDNKARKEDSTSELNLTSDLVASGYAIEFLRRLPNLREDSGSSDRPNDYDTFIIWLNYNTVLIEDIEFTGYNFEGETGDVTFPAGTVSWGSNFIAESNSPIERIYNVIISPARNAARFWSWLGMHTFGLPTNRAKLFFQVGQYYTDYSSRIAGESAPNECLEPNGGLVLAESEDISPSILNTFAQPYILKPIGLDFSAPQSLCDFLSMVTPGTGYVQVNSGKETFYGFIRTANNKPIDPSSGLSEITLLLAYAIPALGDYSDDYSDDFSN
jgi:hypothetical protein